MTPSAPIDLASELSNSLTVHSNIDQAIVMVTEDRLRLCLIDNRDCLTARREWLVPLSLLLTLLTTFVAADFTRRFIFPPPVWEAIYAIGAFLSFVWLVVTTFKAIASWRDASIDVLVERIKSRSVVATGHKPSARALVEGK